MKKNIFILTASILLITLMFSCQKKKEESMEDLNVQKMGTFKSEKASLTIDNIADDVLGGQNLDFQFEFVTPEKSGTFFGTAESSPEGGFTYSYDSIGVLHKFKFNFEEGKWVVEYSAENPENKELFDYTGTYEKKKE